LGAVAHLSFGYNTWNFYLAYHLSPFFDKEFKILTVNSLELNPIKIGLIFYILYNSFRNRATGISSCSRYLAMVLLATMYPFSFINFESTSSVIGFFLFSSAMSCLEYFLFQ